MTSELYDQEFETNLKIAKYLIRSLNNPKEKEIATRWVRKLLALKSSDLAVKKNRNAFFKYLLGVLREGIGVQLPTASSAGGVNTQFSPNFDDNAIRDKGATYYMEDEVTDVGQPPMFMSRWSTDRRTYVAVKPLPGRGALVYMAVTQKPQLGWQWPARKPQAVVNGSAAPSGRCSN